MNTLSDRHGAVHSRSRAGFLLPVGLLLALPNVAVPQTRLLLWGDTHVHTSYSPDAYMFQNRSADPDTAYRFAKGLPVVHPYHRARIQLRVPLDFLIVTDHAEYMGVIPKLFAHDPLVANTVLGKVFLELTRASSEQDVFNMMLQQVNSQVGENELTANHVRAAVWHEIMAAAERHNQPGRFTTFLGWEWTSTPDGANLHRVVLLKEGLDVGRQFVPFSAFDSSRPEDLWSWLEKTSRECGASFIAIPHNSNLSKGQMFPTQDSDGQPITAEYARSRIHWEPVVEATQIKGDSETHPRLSPTDEFADYEKYRHLLEAGEKLAATEPKRADYIRSALGRGLELEARIGTNPYKFGLIGSTDSHTGMASAEEENFWGKMAYDSIPEHKSEGFLNGASGFDMGAAGLAAVWADENTREAIFAALRRKEVYATTGPRIRVRFFGGWHFAAPDLDADDLATTGYAKGVPMGGDLTGAPNGKPPTFLIHAAMDPNGAHLDRIQIVKAYLDGKGKAQERIYDVALSDDRKVGTDGRVPAVGNTVDLATGRYRNSIGAAQLAAVWIDPQFDPRQRALYYVRVLEIPTPRHSLYDAIALGIQPEETGHPATIQERAYTSPIWYTP